MDLKLRLMCVVDFPARKADNLTAMCEPIV
jgi:hypothetical protein